MPDKCGLDKNDSNDLKVKKKSDVSGSDFYCNTDSLLSNNELDHSDDDEVGDSEDANKQPPPLISNGLDDEPVEIL